MSASGRARAHHGVKPWPPCAGNAEWHAKRHGRRRGPDNERQRLDGPLSRTLIEDVKEAERHAASKLPRALERIAERGKGEDQQ